MNKSELLEYIRLGYSTRQMAKITHLSQTTIMYWLHKYGLKSCSSNSTVNKPIQQWEVIQTFYDDNHTCRDVVKKFKISTTSLIKASKMGYLTLRTPSASQKMDQQKTGPRLHSDQTKKKISKKMIEYLVANPERVPYKINHSSRNRWRNS